MDTHDKLDEIDALKTLQLNRSQAEIKNLKEKELKSRWMHFKTMYEELPNQLADAERAYHTFADKDYIDKSLVESAPKVQQEIQTKHNTIFETVNSSISNYESQRTYLKNISDVFFNLRQKINQNMKIQNDNLSNNTTNQQKVYYLKQEYKTVDNVNYFLLLASSGIIGLLLKTMMEQLAMKQSVVQTVFSITGFSILFVVFVVTPWFDTLMVFVMNLLSKISSYSPIVYTTF